MKAEIKIPDGWYKLKRGEVLKRHDRWFDSFEFEWSCVRSGGLPVEGWFIAIRRLPKNRLPAQKGTP